MRRRLPCLDWAQSYSRETLINDLIAALIVTIMLIPQSLAYAMLAGLPPEVGLYASMAPLVLYALFGTSRTLAVGPVAVISLMTAAAIAEVSARQAVDPIAAAAVLALLSGGILLAMGVLRLGFLANFLSHPVISGFITASGLLIAAGQLPALLGLSAGGQSLPELLAGLFPKLAQLNLYTLAISLPVLGFLVWARKGLAPLLRRCGLAAKTAAVISRAAPILTVALSSLAAWGFDLSAKGVALVGEIPAGLPGLRLPFFDAGLWAALLLPALLLSVVGYVETVSVAQTLAARRRQRIDPDQELLALGASNLGAALSGGYPVTGGFARSVVNHEAGAETPAAGAFTAVGMALATLCLTPALFYLPKATLAATIVVAVLTLVDFGALRRSWRYDRADFAAIAATIAVTLAFGVEPGILTGVAVSLILHLGRSSRPHIAVVGQVPGTEHFRNVLRHEVVTAPHVLSLRVDESLYFPNARFLEDRILAAVAAAPELTDVVLMCPAVNAIDASALESLEAIMHRLSDAGLRLHLSEVKGPVMDRLGRSDFLAHLTGEIFLTHCDAMRKLAPQMTAATLALPRCETRRRVA